MAVKIIAPEPRATPVEPGDPVEHPALSQMGATFAERAKAAAKSASKTKAVEAGSVENKSVATKQASTKKKS